MKKGKILIMTLVAVIMITSTASVMVSAVGLVPNSSGSSVYFEGFEDSTILDTIKNNQKGWSIGGADMAPEIAYGNGYGLPSNSIRFSTGNSWWKEMWMSLDLETNGVEKKIAQGIPDTDAVSQVQSYLSGDLSLSFQLNFDYGDLGTDGGKYVVKIIDGDYNSFAALQIVNNKSNNNSTLSLIALDSTKTQNKEYIIEQGNDNVFKKPFNITVNTKRSDNTYQITVNGTPISTDNGIWIPTSSSKDVGAASHKPFAGMTLKQIEFYQWFAGWYQSIVVDNINVSLQDEGIDGYMRNSYIDPIIYSITKVADTESDYKVNVELKNNLCQTLNSKAIYVLYDADNNIVGIKIEDIDVAAKGYYNEHIITSNGVPVKAKAFVWEGLDTMQPFSSSAVSENITY